jgi:hypothetical protein
VRLIDNCAAAVPLRSDLASPVGFGLSRQALAYPVGAVER